MAAWEELTRLGEEIGRVWHSDLSAAELLSEMRSQRGAMAATCTVDASVFLRAFNPYEAGHEESNRLPARMQEEAVPIIVPTLLLPEVAAAVARGWDDADLARQFAAQG
jgi:hypothetical protein